MLKILILILLNFGLINAQCSKHTSCGDCSGKFEFFLLCEWCLSSNKCDNLGSGCTNNNTVGYAYDCPRPVPVGFEYTDDFARKKVLPLIGATNGENDDQIQACLTNNIPSATLYKSYTVKCAGELGEDATCFAYLAVSPTDKAIIIAFRGTQGALQLASEGGDLLFNKIVTFPQVGGKVDKYFDDAYNTLWDTGDMKTGIQSLKLQYTDYELWVVGHSLGGSLASLMSAALVKSQLFKPEKVKVVTFGEPRTGNQDFAKAHDSYLNYTYRIVHNKDSVPHLPLKIEDILDPPVHHRFEIWYPNDMSPGSPYQVCLRADDDSCSGSIPVQDQTPDDHNNYFAVDLPNWYKTGCK